MSEPFKWRGYFIPEIIKEKEAQMSDNVTDEQFTEILWAPTVPVSNEDTKESIDAASLAWAPKGIWGKIKWLELHARAQAPLPMEGEQVWFDDFVRELPCPKCRAHFEEFVQKNPPDLSSRHNFFIWTIGAHNFVNGALGKPKLSFKEAKRLNPYPADG